MAKQKKMGIIDTIEHTLISAGAKKKPVSVDQITSVLKQHFPKRKQDALRSTVQHQVYYLPLQRGLKIKRQREGRNVLYMAKPKPAPKSNHNDGKAA